MAPTTDAPSGGSIGGVEAGAVGVDVPEPVDVDVAVDVAVDVDVDVDVLVAVPPGDDELLVADSEGDRLVDGAECVGVGDCRPLDVGPAELVAVEVFGAVPTLVPRPPSSAELTGTDAVAGDTTWLAD